MNGRTNRIVRHAFASASNARIRTIHFWGGSHKELISDDARHGNEERAQNEAAPVEKRIGANEQNHFAKSVSCQVGDRKVIREPSEPTWFHRASATGIYR